MYSNRDVEDDIRSDSAREDQIVSIKKTYEMFCEYAKDPVAASILTLCMRVDMIFTVVVRYGIVNSLFDELWGKKDKVGESNR